MDPDLFKHLNFRIGISQQTLQQITLGGAMIVLPLFLQMTLEYNAMRAGLSLAPLSLSMFGMAMLAGRKAGKRRPAHIIMAGFGLSTVGMAAIIPLVPRVDSGWYLVIPLVITGSGLGLLVSQLNDFTLAPIAEERVSEAAGVKLRRGLLRVVLGLAMAGGIMLWALALSFTHLTETSTVISPAQQQQISAELEHDAEVMSNTELQQQITGEKATPLAHPGDPSGSPGRRKGTRVSVENADAAPAAEGAATTRAGRTRGPAFPSLCADASMAAPQRRPGS